MDNIFGGSPPKKTNHWRACPHPDQHPGVQSTMLPGRNLTCNVFSMFSGDLLCLIMIIYRLIVQNNWACFINRQIPTRLAFNLRGTTPRKLSGLDLFFGHSELVCSPPHNDAD